MITNGSSYKLLRILDMLDNRSVQFSRDDSFQILRAKAENSMKSQHARNVKTYNIRARVVSFKLGQEVYRHSFKQSTFLKGFSDKLAPSFKGGTIWRYACQNWGLGYDSQIRRIQAAQSRIARMITGANGS